MRTALHQRRARQSLLAAAATIALSPVAGTLLIDRCPMSVRFPEANALVERWHSSVPPPQIVFFGSSRTGRSVSETEIESVMKSLFSSSPPVFNAAAPWGDPLTMRYLAAHLFAAGPIPRLAILEITPQSVARRHTFLEIIITRQFHLADVVAACGEIFHVSSKSISRLLSSRLTPFYRHRHELLTWLRGPLRHFREQSLSAGSLGPRPPIRKQPPPPATDASGRQTPVPMAARNDFFLVRIRKQLADYEVAGLSSAALERLVAACREKGLSVILLQTPLHSTIRDLLRPEVTEKYRAFTDRLERDYGCRFVDISERIPDPMFDDSEHASTEGRTLFSRILAEEILVPTWRSIAQPAEE